MPEKLEIVLGKAILDEDFRNQLFDCPEAICKEYGLDERALEIIKSLSREEIEELAKATENEMIKNSAGIIFCVG
jgi:hypothetical protein